MADVESIREALAAALDTIDGLRAYPIAPDSPNPPAALVWPARGTFKDTVTFDGSNDYLFTVTVLVSKVSDRVSQDQLDVYLGDGPSSIEAAVTADQTLGGLVAYVGANEVTNYGLLDWAGVTYLGAELSITVGT